jgi:hypothetical protein
LFSLALIGRDRVPGPRHHAHALRAAHRMAREEGKRERGRGGRAGAGRGPARGALSTPQPRARGRDVRGRRRGRRRRGAVFTGGRCCAAAARSGRDGRAICAANRFHPENFPRGRGRRSAAARFLWLKWAGSRRCPAIPSLTCPAARPRILEWKERRRTCCHPQQPRCGG